MGNNNPVGSWPPPLELSLKRLRFCHSKRLLTPYGLRLFRIHRNLCLLARMGPVSGRLPRHTPFFTATRAGRIWLSSNESIWVNCWWCSREELASHTHITHWMVSSCKWLMVTRWSCLLNAKITCQQIHVTDFCTFQSQKRIARHAWSW